MKILFLRREFPKTSETFIINELIELEKLGADFRILAERPFDTTRHPAYLESGLEKKIVYAYKMTEDPDIDRDSLIEVISTGGKPFYPNLIYCPFGASRYVEHALFLSKLLEVPFVVNYRAKEIYERAEFDKNLGTGQKIRKEMQTLARTMLAHKAAGVFTTSEFNLIELKKSRDYLRNIFVYHSGTDADFFCPGPNISREKNTILCVSRFIPKKGIENLIEACAILKARDLDFKLKLVGFGPLEQTYRNMITKLGLDKNFEMCSAMNSGEVRNELRKATLFALPSVVDPSGNRDILATSLQEAMACEVPVLTTNLPGNEELISNEVEGLLSPANDPEALAKNLMRLLQDTKLRKKLGTNGRVKIMNSFSMRHEMKRVYGEFERILSSK